MKKYKLEAGTYDFGYYLVTSPDQKKVGKFIRDHFDDPSWDDPLEGERRGALYTRFNYKPILWIANIPKTPREYAILAHECLHLTIYILIRWAGMKLTYNESEEAFTHLLSKIMTDTLTVLQNEKTKARKVAPRRKGKIK